MSTPRALRRLHLSDDGKRGPRPGSAGGEHTARAVRGDHDLEGFTAIWSDGTEGVVEGPALVVWTDTVGSEVRVVPVDAVLGTSESERRVWLSAPVKRPAVAGHRALRRFGRRWRVDLSLDAPRAPDPAFWLAHCADFLVDSPEGTIGVVYEVLRDDDGRADTLRVRGSAWRRREYLVDGDDVVEVVPDERLLVVGHAEDAREVERPAG